MRRSRNQLAMAAFTSLLSACALEHGITTPNASNRSDLSALSDQSVTITDISNGLVGGGGFAIASSGLIVGSLAGSNRVWWQAPSPAFTKLDSGYVNGGNSAAEIGSGATVLLNSGGAPPFTVVNLQVPVGTTANRLVARDINDSRVIVGSSGSFTYGLRWASPTSPATPLMPGSLGYPVQQVFPMGISNSGLIAGWVVLEIRKNTTKYVAVVWNGSDTATLLPSPVGAVSSIASNVNNAGVISGHWYNGRIWAPIRWTPNGSGGYDVAVVNLDVGGSNGPTGIDECGRITGGSPQGAWIWDPSSGLTILPGIGGAGLPGWSHSISASGAMVGSSYNMSGRKGTYHATLWTGLAACSL